MSSKKYHTAKDSFFVDSDENIKIEVLHYPPTNKVSNHPPILFIHGAFLAAWSWNDFSHWFSNKGHDCYAMSFRGHGQSTRTPDKDKWWSLDDITSDISAVTDAIIAKTEDKPILVGHSMGGGFLQNYLQTNHQKVSGGVLFASVSPYNYKTNVLEIIYKTLKAQPILPLLKSLITSNLYATVETPELMKKAFFSSAFPDTMAREIHPRLNDFEFITGLLEFGKPFVDPSKIKCPIIVIGAEEENIFPENLKNISETAQAYGVGFDMIKGAGHEIMLDLTWEKAANVVYNRIQGRILNKK